MRRTFKLRSIDGMTSLEFRADEAREGFYSVEMASGDEVSIVLTIEDEDAKMIREFLGERATDPRVAGVKTRTYFSAWYGPVVLVDWGHAVTIQRMGAKPGEFYTTPISRECLDQIEGMRGWALKNRATAPGSGPSGGGGEGHGGRGVSLGAATGYAD